MKLSIEPPCFCERGLRAGVNIGESLIKVQGGAQSNARSKVHLTPSIMKVESLKAKGFVPKHNSLRESVVTREF